MSANITNVQVNISDVLSVYFQIDGSGSNYVFYDSDGDGQATSNEICQYTLYLDSDFDGFVSSDEFDKLDHERPDAQTKQQMADEINTALNKAENTIQSAIDFSKTNTREIGYETSRGRGDYSGQSPVADYITHQFQLGTRYINLSSTDITLTRTRLVNEVINSANAHLDALSALERSGAPSSPYLQYYRNMAAVNISGIYIYDSIRPGADVDPAELEGEIDTMQIVTSTGVFINVKRGQDGTIHHKFADTHDHATGIFVDAE